MNTLARAGLRGGAQLRSAKPRSVSSSDFELLAQQVNGINEKVADLGRRMAEVERVNARLEQAALSTARSMEEISRHWDAVYEAMRRTETESSETADSASSSSP
jgi:hypothetical protein